MIWPLMPAKPLRILLPMPEKWAAPGRQTGHTFEILA